MTRLNSQVYSVSMENIVGNECCKINKPIEKIDARNTQFVRLFNEKMMGIT